MRCTKRRFGSKDGATDTPKGGVECDLHTRHCWVLLHNGGSWNACTITVHSSRSRDGMVLFPNCWLYKIVISTTSGNMPCMVLSKYNIFLKVCFFPDREEWCRFHKIPDFSCCHCVKRVFYSAIVWKCTDMCKHRFGVQLLQNPPLCSSTHCWPCLEMWVGPGAAGRPSPQPGRGFGSARIIHHHM